MFFVTSRPPPVTVSASIGTNHLTLFGYTAPQATVKLSNYLFDLSTISGVDGYFEFDRLLIPKNTPDLCLQSFDQLGRQSLPLCFPPPPATNYHTRIGPLLLSPSLSLNNPPSARDSSAYASGQTIPNSTVSLHFFQSDPNSTPLSPHPAQALELPQLVAIADNLGNYSFNLPSSFAANYRLFATTTFREAHSPKSPTLSYQLASQFNFLPLIFFTLFTLLILFSIRFLKKRHHYLPAIRRFWPALYPKSLAVRNS